MDRQRLRLHQVAHDRLVFALLQVELHEPPAGEAVELILAEGDLPGVLDGDFL